MRNIFRASQWREQRVAEQLMAVRSTRSGQRQLAVVRDAQRQALDEPQPAVIRSLVAAGVAQRQLEQSARRMVTR